MFNCQHPIARLRALFATAFGGMQGSAQTSRSSADAFPRGAHAPLAVVQDDQGYSIQAKADRIAPVQPMPARMVVPIGTGFELDRSLFAASARPSPEAFDASRR